MIELTESQRKKILKTQQSQIKLLESFVSELYKSKCIAVGFDIFLNRIIKIFEYLRKNYLHSTPKSLFALSIYYAIEPINRNYYLYAQIVGITHVAIENMIKVLVKRDFKEEKMKAMLNYD